MDQTSTDAKGRTIQAQPGPQAEFMRSPADIAIYGGAAGGGKSFALVFESARNVHVKGYNGIIFRRTSPELRGEGSIWAEGEKLYDYFGGDPREHDLRVRFPAGSEIKFNHLQHEKDKKQHQGKAYAFVAFDELTHFTKGQFVYLLSRMRTTCGVRPYMRATCNPDATSWVKDFISWWLDEKGDQPNPEKSGKLRWFTSKGDDWVWGDSKEEVLGKVPGGLVLSMTFIPASLDDNPALLKSDPGYKARLMALPRSERMALLHGSWLHHEGAGEIFQRQWFEVVDALPKNIVASCRAWDRAATEPSVKNPDPDWTASVRARKAADGVLYIDHVERFQRRPHAVDTAIKRNAAIDGVDTTVALWRDPGQAGVKDVEDMTSKLWGYFVKSTTAAKNKVAYSRPVSSQAEAGNIKLVRGPWLEEFLTELENFPDGAHDDMVDALSLAFLTLQDDNLDAFNALTKV